MCRRTVRLAILALVSCAVACNVALLNFRVPQSVLAGSLFDVVVVGQSATGGPPSMTTDSVGAVLQLPTGFVVDSAVAGTGAGVFAVSTNPSNLLALYSVEPGHYLAAFSAVPTSTSPATLRVRVRAPAAPGIHTLKISLAATQAGVWVAAAPAGVTNFSGISGAGVAHTLSVVAGPVDAPTWRLNAAGLLVNSPPFAATLSGPFDVDLADYDQDGRMDLVAGNLVSTAGAPPLPHLYCGQVLEGWSTQLLTPPFQGRSRFGDFNGDGRADLVLERFVYLGNGAGGFAPLAPLPTPPGLTSPSATKTAVAVGDVNGDNLDDIVISEGQLEVFRSLGNGSFAAANGGLPAVQTMSGVGALQLEDLDLDGDLDIVIGAIGGGTPTAIVVYFNDGAANWTAAGAAGTGLIGGTSITGIGVGLVNGDLLPDLVIGKQNGGVAGINGSGFNIHYGVAGGTWDNGSVGALTSIGVYTDFAVDDLNGDGRADLIALQSTNNTFPGFVNFGLIRVGEGFPGGGFAFGTTLESGLTQDGTMAVGRMIHADADADGLADIIVASNTGVSVFSRVGPVQTSAYGTTGLNGAGGPFPVLTVNGSSGSTTTRAVSVGIGLPLAIAVAQSPTVAVPSRYIVWGRLGLPTAADAFPSLVGTFTFAPQIAIPMDPFSFTIANSFQPFDPFAVVQGALPGPFVFMVPGGVPFPFRFTLEGIIDDPTAPFGLARTDTVFVDID